ncbi:hypothetical protein Tco_1132439, partial [Tanacetum coccineum]
MKARRDPRVQPKYFKAVRQEWDAILGMGITSLLSYNDRLDASKNALPNGYGSENRCNPCIRVLHFNTVCDNCSYHPLNTNFISTRRVGNRVYETRSALWRDLKRRMVTKNTWKDVIESNIGTQTSIAESANLHNHTQSAIHLRQLPSIHAISQDPPIIHTISQEENSAAAHSSTERCQPKYVCNEVTGTRYSKGALSKVAKVAKVSVKVQIASFMGMAKYCIIIADGAHDGSELTDTQQVADSWCSSQLIITTGA